jgi:hypothetical protein
MSTDTVTTIENRFFDGLKAIQEPTLQATRTVSSLVSRLPLVDSAADLAPQLPSAESIVEQNFAFTQRLLDTQREFVTELVAIVTEPLSAPAPKAKKSA